MMNVRYSFYKNSVAKWIKDTNASVLVVGGGLADKCIFQELEFKHVVISNLDTRLSGDEFYPYKWSYQNASQLNYEDCSFDFVVVHAALHHCEAPHRALLEMYRVAKIGIIAFESRDSFVMKVIEALKLTQTYEHAAVYYSDDCKFGGVNNTEIPNYIYRWTEREVEKTINSYAPYAYHHFHYRYGYDVPCTPVMDKKSQLKLLFVSIVQPFYKIFSLLFPKQQNLFGFYIEKPNIPNDLYPWLSLRDEKIRFNALWGQNVYK